LSWLTHQKNCPATSASLQVLPDDLPRLKRLRVLFCSNNLFTTLSSTVLGRRTSSAWSASQPDPRCAWRRAEVEACAG
jgi:hypothetical protein